MGPNSGRVPSSNDRGSHLIPEKQHLAWREAGRGANSPTRSSRSSFKAVEQGLTTIARPLRSTCFHQTGRERFGAPHLQKSTGRAFCLTSDRISLVSS